MNDRWYLVKRNWPQISVRNPAFAGVGGDVWPLDAVEDRNAKAIHSMMLASREHLKVGEYEELLCTKPSVAEAYWAEAQRRLGGAWLLEVTLGVPEVAAEAGVDLGFPSGGFSLVETELITQALPGPLLNKWGLIDGMAGALTYLKARMTNEDLEELDGVVALAVRVVHRGS